LSTTAHTSAELYNFSHLNPLHTPPRISEMSLPNPPGLLIAPLLFYSLYRFFPRAVRCFFIALGLSSWRSNPANLKDTIESCTTSHGQWELDRICQGNISLLVMEVVVYTIAIICAFTEVEGVISKGRFKSGKAE
jgi:hypothetical protein